MHATARPHRNGTQHVSTVRQTAADSSRLGETPKAFRHNIQIALTRKSLEALEKNVGGRVHVELNRDVRAWIPSRHLRHDVTAARVDRRNHLAVNTNRELSTLRKDELEGIVSDQRNQPMCTETKWRWSRPHC